MKEKDNTKKHPKLRKAGKIVLIVIAVLLALLILFSLVTFIIHRIKSGKEFEALKENGYYTPVSVGDRSLNVIKFGNENGKHRLVFLAGLGCADHSVAERRMTSKLEDDNLVVFPNRAGYSYSDDADDDMTIEFIVEDYRAALKAAGVEAPYVLVPHSISGLYSTYWVSKYPEEIEGIVFLDGTVPMEDDEELGEPDYTMGLGKGGITFLAKMGFSRYLLSSFTMPYIEPYSDNDQYLGDALNIKTWESRAFFSECEQTLENNRKTIDTIKKTDVPKIYVSAGYAFETIEDLLEDNKWSNRVYSDEPPLPTGLDELDEETEEMYRDFLEFAKEYRETTLAGYIEKLGNCELISLPGDHMIYSQKPDECAKIITDFLTELDN